MNVSTLSEFEGPDFVAFVVSALIGYFVGTLVPTSASLYVNTLLSYHLFLAWLILVRRDGTSGGVSLPIGHTILTHTACLILILGPVVGAQHYIQNLRNVRTESAASMDLMTESIDMAIERRTMRMVGAVCSAMASMAIFERRWLFSSEKQAKPTPPPQPQPSTPTVRSTADDAVEWNQYLAANRHSFRTGTSLKAEYEKWLLARRNTDPQTSSGPDTRSPDAG